MKIRTQLILAFLLISVLPLTGIVLYSYYSSQQAVRRAQHQEAEEMAKQMDRRVAEVRREVGSRLALLGNLPMGTILRDASSGEMGAQAAGRLLAEMGDAAPFVESIELIPHAPRPAASAGVPGVPAPPAPETRVVRVGPTPTVPATHPVPPVPPSAPRIVINVDEVIRDVGRALEQSGAAMTPARAAELEESLRKAGEVAGQIVQQQALSREWEVSFEQAFEARAQEIEASLELSEEARELQQILGQSEIDPGEKARQERALARARERLEQIRKQNADVQAQVQQRTAAAPAPKAAVTLEPAESTAKKLDQTKILFGRELHVPIQSEGEVIGQIRPRIRAGMLVESILGASERGSDEIPFALDPEGNLYTADEPSREVIRELGITEGGSSRRVLRNWVLATSRDEESGLTLGIARRIREPLAEVRRAAGRSFAYGMVLIGFALIGILPIANHMTRDVELVTHGAERISQGDLETELPVRSKGEFGALALAFNRMAHDLRDHQHRLVEQERLRKEDDIQRRLLAAEFERKSAELEEARRFQLSLLPKEIPRLPGLDIAVHIRTATEVGGDYYDFHAEPDGALTIAVGDAIGHGARAGTMVTIVKSLFMTFGDELAPSDFLLGAGEQIRKMDLGRMSMALLLARISGRRVTVSSAGMPPVLLHRRRTGRVEELVTVGMPLGTLAGGYTDVEASLEPGDALLLMSDGFPELLDRNGDPLGYPAAEQTFRSVAGETAAEIVRALAAAADERTEGEPPNDDITFVVVKVGGVESRKVESRK